MSRGPYKARPVPGSFADLILRFRQSPRYRSWRASTAHVNDRIMDEFMAANGRRMVAELRRGDLIGMRDSMADTPAAANNWMKVIRVLLAYAVDLEMVPYNVALKIPKLKTDNPDGFRQWREDEITAYLRYWRPDTIPHLAMVLMLCTGAARSDAVLMGWGNINGERIRYRRMKTGAWVDLPVLPLLRTAIDAIEDDRTTFLQTSSGAVRSEKAISGQMPIWAAKALGTLGKDGKPVPDENGRHLNCHGLRKAMGRRLAEAGCSAHEVMAILGHSDIKQAMTYTKAYDRARAADSAAEKLGAVAAPTVVRLERKGGGK